jgi:hypothetical protein
MTKVATLAEGKQTQIYFFRIFDMWCVGGRALARARVSEERICPALLC